jgi:hypothetical protein
MYMYAGKQKHLLASFKETNPGPTAQVTMHHPLKEEGKRTKDRFCHHQWTWVAQLVSDSPPQIRLL